MKKILLTFFVFVSWLIAAGQINERNANERVLRGIFEKSFRFPRVCGTPTSTDLMNYASSRDKGTTFFDTCNNRIIVWTGSTWLPFKDSSFSEAGSGIYIISESCRDSVFSSSDSSFLFYVQRSNGRNSGGFVTLTSGYTYNVTAANYALLCQEYDSRDTTLTLSAAHPTLNRFDVIYIDTSGRAQIRAGTAAANPVEPQTDDLTEIKLALIQVTAASSGPTTVTRKIFDQDVSSEWNSHANSAGLSVNYTSSAQATSGSTSAEVSNVTTRDNYISFIRPGGDSIISGFTTLQFKIRLKAPLRTAAMYVYFATGGNTTGFRVGSQVQIPVSSSSQNTWETIVINMSDFGIVTGSSADRFVVRLTGTSSGHTGYFVDDIQIISGSVAPPPITTNYVQDIQRVGDAVQQKVNGIYSDRFYLSDFLKHGDTSLMLNPYLRTAWFNGYFDARFATKTSDNLAEGSTNLYYTAARAALKLNISDTANMMRNAVRSVYRKAGSDSVFAVSGAGTVFAFRDSIGGGGGGGSQWDNVSGGINYAGGRVGIGNSSPQFKLDLNGDTLAIQGAHRYVFDGDSVSAIFYYTDSALFLRSVSFRYMIVSGGGGGAAGLGGGGGAGGVLVGTTTLGAAKRLVAVGAGGRGGIFNVSAAQNGGNSSVTNLGGSTGGGAGGYSAVGQNGGSGGGGGVGAAGGTGVAGQGSAGGTAVGSGAPNWGSAGGGGYSSAGGNGTTTNGGNGGAGLYTNITGAWEWFAGGGGGGGLSVPSQGLGGSGIGGAGGYGGRAAQFTGSGGGSGPYQGEGGDGANGIVVFKFKRDNPRPASVVVNDTLIAGDIFLKRAPAAKPYGTNGYHYLVYDTATKKIMGAGGLVLPLAQGGSTNQQNSNGNVPYVWDGNLLQSQGLMFNPNNRLLMVGLNNSGSASKNYNFNSTTARLGIYNANSTTNPAIFAGNGDGNGSSVTWVLRLNNGNAGAEYAAAHHRFTGNVAVGSNNNYGTLTIEGGMAPRIRSVAANTSLTATDYTVLVNATASTYTMTLPTAVGANGRIYIIKKTDSSANAVTVATTSSQTIDGATTYSLAAQYKFLQVQSDGANWQIIGNN